MVESLDVPCRAVFFAAEGEISVDRKPLLERRFWKKVDDSERWMNIYIYIYIKDWI